MSETRQIVDGRTRVLAIVVGERSDCAELSAGTVRAVIAAMPLARSTRLAFLALPVALATGCVGNIQRSARVPHPDVPLTTGQPMDAPAELSVGLGNVADIIAPKVADATQAVEVPGTQMRDEARVRLFDNGQLGFIYERGFGGTTEKPDPTQAPIGPGDVEGYGMSLGYTITTNTPGFVIGTTLELIEWSVPYVEYTTCTNCDDGGYVIQDHGRTTVATIGIGIQPSYRSGRWTVFGGAFARNHPTTDRKSLDTDVTFSDDGDVQSGPLNVLLNAGVAYELDNWLSALVVVHQDVIASPLQYGPGVGFALTAKLGR